MRPSLAKYISMEDLGDVLLADITTSLSTILIDMKECLEREREKKKII